MGNINRFILIALCIIIVGLLFYFINKIMLMEQNQKHLSDFLSGVQIKTEVYERNFNAGNKMTGLKADDVLCSEIRKDSVFSIYVANSWAPAN